LFSTSLENAQAHEEPLSSSNGSPKKRLTVWWDATPAEVSRDEAIREVRAHYERDQRLQRHHG
jgi:TPP-dependent trihydroxycyclohexane-1,2-dione (THcHDO) dehydratase